MGRTPRQRRQGHRVRRALRGVLLALGSRRGREGGIGDDGDGVVDDVKRELFTTECNHTYHRCCLVRCREADFTLCCLCKTGASTGKG